MNRNEIKEQFERDTKNHSMEVLMDNGLYRHLKFTNNGSSVYRFDIITWPGYLTVAGDMGEWVFSRIPDMFEFFIMDERDFNKKNIINPGYWGEKLQAADKNSLSHNTTNGYTEFNDEMFESAIKEEYDQFLEEFEIDSSSDYATELWGALESEVIGACSDGPHAGYEAAMSFEFKANDWRIKEKIEGIPDFKMHDFWEHDCTDYIFHYIWVLYAIVWGITKYNEAKEQAA